MYKKIALFVFFSIAFVSTRKLKQISTETQDFRNLNQNTVPAFDFIKMGNIPPYQIKKNINSKLLLDLIDQTLKSEILYKKLRYSELNVKLFQILSETEGVLRVNKFQDDSLFNSVVYSFITAIGNLMKHLSVKEEKINGKTYLQIHYEFESFKEFGVLIGQMFTIVKKNRQVYKQIPAFYLIESFLDDLLMTIEASFVEKGKIIIESTKYFKEDETLVEDYEIRAQNTQAKRVLFLSRRMREEVEVFNVNIKYMQVYSHLITITYIFHSIFLQIHWKPFQNHCDNFLDKLMRLLDSAEVETSIYNSKKAFYFFNKQKFDLFVGEIRSFLAIEFPVDLNEKSKNMIHVYKLRLVMILELLESKYRNYADDYVREIVDSFEIKNNNKELNFASSKKSEAQIQITKKVTKLLDGNSISYKPNSYTIFQINVRNLFSEILNFFKIYYLENDQIELFEKIYQEANDLLSSSKTVKIEEAPTHVMGMAYNPEMMKTFIGSFGSILEIISMHQAKMEEEPHQLFHQIFDSYNVLALRIKEIFMQNDEFDFEVLLPKSEIEDFRRRILGKIYTQTDKSIMVQKYKRVIRIFAFEVVVCDACKNDNLLSNFLSK